MRKKPIVNKEIPVQVMVNGSFMAQGLAVITNDEKGKTLTLACGECFLTINFQQIEEYLRDAPPAASAPMKTVERLMDAFERIIAEILHLTDSTYTVADLNLKVFEDRLKKIVFDKVDGAEGNEEDPLAAEMTLEEAIQHCEEKADASRCGREHEQLAQWLRELSWFRKVGRRPFYFTFGSAKEFPYQNGFLIVYAGSGREAAEKFKVLHPNQHEGVLNCSDYYDEVEWKEILEQGFYKGAEPFEIIR